MRGPALAVLLLAAPLAGCVGSEDPSMPTSDAADAPADNGTPQALSLSGCREAFGQWELPYEEVAPYLPPGFAPAGGALGASETGRNASMELIAVRCSEPRDASFFFPWLAVEPPDELANPDATFRFVALPCIADASTAETFDAWGASCEAGTVDLARDGDAPLGGAWTLTAESPNRTVTLQGAGAEEPTAAGVTETIQLYHSVDAHLCAITTAEVGDHRHTEPGPFTLEVQGEAGFPVPDEPGTGSLVRSGFDLNVTSVAPDPRPAVGGEGCPEPSGESAPQEGRR